MFNGHGLRCQLLGRMQQSLKNIRWFFLSSLLGVLLWPGRGLLMNETALAFPSKHHSARGCAGSDQHHRDHHHKGCESRLNAMRKDKEKDQCPVTQNHRRVREQRIAWRFTFSIGPTFRLLSQENCGRSAIYQAPKERAIMDSTIPELTEQKIVEKLQTGDQHDRQPNGAKIHNVPGIERLSRELGIDDRGNKGEEKCTANLGHGEFADKRNQFRFPKEIHTSKAVMAIAQAMARK